MRKGAVSHSFITYDTYLKTRKRIPQEAGRKTWWAVRHTRSRVRASFSPMHTAVVPSLSRSDKQKVVRPVGESRTTESGARKMLK